MDKYFILILIVLVGLGCTNEKPAEGHWHLERTYIVMPELTIGTDYSTEFYNKQSLTAISLALLDIEENHATWNKGVNGYDGLPVYFDMEVGKLNLELGEDFHEEFKFKLRKDTLELVDVKNELVFKGYQCLDSCCDKQKEHFLHNNLIIDLPIEKGTSQSEKYKLDRVLESRIYLSSRINSLMTHCSTSSRISTDRFFCTAENIPLIVEKEKKRLFEQYEEKITFSIYADKNADMKTIASIMEQFRQSGIQKVYLALREDTDLSKEFKIRLRTLDTNINLNATDDISLKEWLND